jgi:phosphoribosylaminoimidazole-succinocarboxamide synthase
MMRLILDKSEHSLVKRGKVRDIYSAGDSSQLMIIATDRISAFDFVLPTPIPEKGIILTQMSNFWFKKTEHIVPNHLVDTDPEWINRCLDEISGRAILVKKAKPLLIEAIVRGYLAGSGWREYRETGHICGTKLPPNLHESEKLSESIYTPSTKEKRAMHDVNISFVETVNLIGANMAEKIRNISLRLYSFAAEYALKRGIIIADTKFEFGLVDGELILIDELLTPDSSRFWPMDSYKPGRSQHSFDKQYVRDYLDEIGWNKVPPVPELPAEIVEKTISKYKEALKRLVAVKETPN